MQKGDKEKGQNWTPEEWEACLTTPFSVGALNGEADAVSQMLYLL